MTLQLCLPPDLTTLSLGCVLILSPCWMSLNSHIFLIVPIRYIIGRWFWQSNLPYYQYTSLGISISNLFTCQRSLLITLPAHVSLSSTLVITYNLLVSLISLVITQTISFIFSSLPPPVTTLIVSSELFATPLSFSTHFLLLKFIFQNALFNSVFYTIQYAYYSTQTTNY